jgi:hypothetical protein
LPWQPWPFASEPPAGLYFCEPAPELEQHLAKRYRPELETMTQRIVTHLAGPLHHQRLPDANLHAGSQVAPLVAHAMLIGAREQVGQVDFALHNAGGVRCSLEPGPLSEADIAGRLLPFAIPLTLYRVHGHELAEALEGAIDNATGVAGILEIAGKFAGGPRPGRSLLFTVVTLEESGLLGSKYYVANPVVPLHKTVEPDALRYAHVSVHIDRSKRTAIFTVKAPTGSQPGDVAGIEAAGADWYPLQMARERDPVGMSAPEYSQRDAGERFLFKGWAAQQQGSRINQAFGHPETGERRWTSIDSAAHEADMALIAEQEMRDPFYEVGDSWMDVDRWAAGGATLAGTLGMLTALAGSAAAMAGMIEQITGTMAAT